MRRSLFPAAAMTSADREGLHDRLMLHPGDWDVRLVLVEDAVRVGDLSAAKRLVRASPADQPTPPEVQVRLHALLTGRIEASPPAASRILEPVPPETSASRVLEPVFPGISACRVFEPVPPETAASTQPHNSGPWGEGRPPSSPPPGGGLGALVESDLASRGALPEDSPRGSGPVVARKAGSAPTLRKTPARDKWKDYEGAFELALLEPIERIERPSTRPERISSLSLALVAHLAALILLSLVVIHVRQPAPPQLVVSVVHEREADLVTTRITRPSLDPTPSAAAAQAVDVISSVGASSGFQVPDVETPSDTLVSAVLPGVAPAGTGLSLSGQKVDSSDVNFFGLSGSGRRLVFIIDATPDMLVDEKGGMSAYNRVKEEVGVMLANLNRASRFNLLLYQGKELVAFRPEPVPGLPSNLRQAIEWLEPLNRDYGALGLQGDYGPSLAVADGEDLPIAAGDVAHYTKAVEKALEWQANAIFCITAGYRSMNRAPTPEMRARMADLPVDTSTVDSREQAAWQAAVAKTREWLARENEARREKGLDPKVVVNFNQLVREVTGAAPPQRRGNRGAGMPGMPPVTPEDIERQVDLLVKREFREQGHEDPSLHMVVFLGEGEELEEAEEDHFRTLTRRNRGKLKVLRGLAALKNVTGPGR